MNKSESKFILPPFINTKTVVPGGTIGGGPAGLIPLVFHSTLEDENSITTPSKGPAMLLTGSPLSFGTGRFGDGLQGVTNKGAQFNPVDYWATNDEGAIGFWIVPGANFLSQYNEIIGARSGGGSTPEFHVRLFSPDSLNVVFSETGVADYFNSSISASSVLSVGVPAHIQVTWNRNGIQAGANTYEVRVDNVLVMSSTSAFPSITWPAADVNYHLANIAPLSTSYFRGVLDNVKFYQTDKNDASDKDTEFA